MIRVEEARKLLEDQVAMLKPVVADSIDAVDCILAEDIFSTIDIPSFNQSSMDGYAVFTGGRNDRRFFEIVGEIKAGDNGHIHLCEGEAVRIFTGAAVPVNANAIVIQEKTKEKDGILFVEGNIYDGAFIRIKGAQTKKGDLAIRKGSVLTPATIAHLASLGINSVSVYRKPSVSVVVTGNEIIPPGKALSDGQVYESNSYSLRAALKQLHIPLAGVSVSRDEKEELRSAIENELQKADLLIITGGISVGKYDLVQDVLTELGVKTIFYKILQKPGKPLYAGKSGKKIVFALPGNPASALVCFYEYVLPAIRKMMGYAKINPEALSLETLHEIRNNDERACFIRARTEAGKIRPLEGQDSYMLHSFAAADAFIFIPAGKDCVLPGEKVEVHLIPKTINCC